MYKMFVGVFTHLSAESRQQVTGLLEAGFATVFLAELIYIGWELGVVRVQSPLALILFLCGPGMLVAGMYVQGAATVVSRLVRFQREFGVSYMDDSARSRVHDALIQQAGVVDAAPDGSEEKRAAKARYHELYDIAFFCGIRFDVLGPFLGRVQKQGRGQ